MSKPKKYILTIIIFILTAIAIFSFIKIILWYIDNQKTKEQIANLSKNATIIEKEDTSNTLYFCTKDCKKNKFINVDFTDIEKQNNEVVGWVEIPGTNINYPFVQHKNNTYYLTHSFDKTYNESGWVFLDYRNNINELNTNTIIYAHGRIDGTMFGSLKDTLNDTWQQNKENHVVKISTPYTNYIFEVFSIYHIPTTNDYLYTSFNNNKEYQDFIELITKRSLYNFNTTMQEQEEKIITLSTCYNNKEKMVLHAKLLKQEKRY